MFTTFGAITQPFIKIHIVKNKTRLLASILFYETRAKNIAYRVLSCVIYTIIKNYVCIDYLACQFFQKVKYLLDMKGVLNMVKVF